MKDVESEQVRVRVLRGSGALARRWGLTVPGWGSEHTPHQPHRLRRYAVVPTVTVLAVMKARLQGATKGHALLKKKADALNMRFRQILKKIVQTKEQMGDVMKASFFSLAQARYATGDFKHTVVDSVEQVWRERFWRW